MLKRLCTLLLLTLCCRAEDLTLANGDVLKDAAVIRQGDEELQIRHAGGIEKFSYKELTPELQVRYNMTPELVEARRQAAADAETEKQRARDAAKAERERLKREDQEARMAALEAAGKHARYISGAEVIQLCSSFLTLEARAAEYLAAEWNRREALRLNLTLDTGRFTTEADSLRADFERDRKQFESMRAELSDKRAKVQAQAASIKRKNEEIKALRVQVAKLNKELGQAEAAAFRRPATPIYIPTYVRPVCPRPVIHRPRVAPPRPPRPPRPLPPRPRR